jgi:Ser/Thr protein kinase RdoA (MazF antagonist)
MKCIKQILVDNYSADSKEQINLIRDGIDNNVYTFRTLDNQKLIARVNKTGQIPSLQFEVNLVKELIDRNVPTAKVVPSKNNELFIEITPKQALVCFEFIQGHPIEYGPDYVPKTSLVKQAGSALGIFHQATLNLSLKIARKRTIYTELENSLTNQTNIINTYNDGESFINGVKDTLSKAKSNKYDSPAGIIHNDYNTSNVLFKNMNLQAILDFDWACPGPLLMDVGYGAMSWSTAEKNTKPNETAFCTFISSYNLTSPLNVILNNKFWFWAAYSCLYLGCGFLNRMAVNNQYNLSSSSQSHMYKRYLYYLKKTK